MLLHVSYIVAIVLFIGCSAFFTAAEMSIFKASPIVLRHWEEAGNERAAVALSLFEKEEDVLRAIDIGDAFANIMAFGIGTLYCIKFFGTQGAIVGVALLFFAVLLIGEMLPKALTQLYENRVICYAAKPLKIVLILFKPLNLIFSGLLHMVVGRAGAEEDDDYVEEELLSMVDEAQNEGDLEAHEVDLIRSAIRFEDLQVRDIFQPRVHVIGIDDENSWEEVLQLFVETGYSRLPVYHETIDNIVGVLHLKDVFNAIQAHAGHDYLSLMKPVEFILQQTRASKLLTMLQKNQSHMAIVTDEYGGTVGVVTLEDIIEELVGDIWDEHDVVEDDVRQEGDGYVVDGDMEIEDFFEFFQMNFEDYEENIEAASIGGWVMDLLGHIPIEGETVTYAPFEMIVEEATKRHIEKVRIKIIE